MVRHFRGLKLQEPGLAFLLIVHTDHETQFLHSESLRG